MVESSTKKPVHRGGRRLVLPLSCSRGALGVWKVAGRWGGGPVLGWVGGTLLGPEESGAVPGCEPGCWFAGLLGGCLVVG